jgi:hypothetical protein
MIPVVESNDNSCQTHAARKKNVFEEAEYRNIYQDAKVKLKTWNGKIFKPGFMKIGDHGLK